MADTHAQELAETRPVTIGTLPALVRLRDEIADAGFDFLDFQDLQPHTEAPLYVLWDFGSFAVIPRTLRDIPREHVIAWCLESPLVAHRAYHRLDAIAASSASVLTFPGAKALFSDGINLRPILYPNEPRPVADDPPWHQRDLLVLISTNKTVRLNRGVIEAAHPYRTARKIIAALLAASYETRGRWSAPDLYAERVKAINHFAKQRDFTLFGSGWSRSARRGNASIAHSYKGAVRDKHEALRGFRFALCFENTRFPGYITEKIFDCFYAGTIPIYLGAPDVTDYIASDAFIDAASFSSYDDLERFIRGMTRERAEQHLRAAAEFLSSDRAQPFSSRHFVERMMSALEDAAGRG